MFGLIQFPICDARPFAPEGSLRLPLPGFPAPRLFPPEFVRRFGPAAERGGDAAWLGEVEFCQAHRAIKFPSLSQQFMGSPPFRVKPETRFRRLFNDGRAVVRVEVGIGHNSGPTAPSAIPGENALAIADDLLRIESVVTLSPNDKPHSLVSQGQHLAELYWRSSTRSGAPEVMRVQRQLVAPGRPLVLLEFGPDELAALPRLTRALPPTMVRGAHVGFAWVKSPLGPVGIWFMSPGEATADDLRSLRLCLLRLHAERQVLDTIIRLFDARTLTIAPETEATQALQTYLSDATSLTNRDKLYGVSQSAIKEAYDASLAVDRPYAIEELAKRYEGLRRQIGIKLATYAFERGQSRDVMQHIVQVTAGGIYVEHSVGPVTGEQYSGTISNSPGAAIGKGNQSFLSQVQLTNAGGDASSPIDPRAVSNALMSLHAAVGESKADPAIKIGTQTAIGQALAEGIDIDKEVVQPQVVVDRVKQAADTLKQANQAVEEGSTLWQSVVKVAGTLGPLVVGGARLVGMWFGVPVP